jgi:ABC-type phosphate/phosphonate transport system substrate-binding protein
MTHGKFRPVRLPMYDWPEVADETRDLEAALTDEICSALAIAPSDLEPWDPEVGLYDLWTDPALLLAQTCGYPLTHKLAGKVHLLGAPNYLATGCTGAKYCSQIVVAKNGPFQSLADLKGARAVFNGPDSQSGMNAFRDTIAPTSDGCPFFASVAESGGHLASMDAVANGRTDVAAIDAVCWALAEQEKPSLANQLRASGANRASSEFAVRNLDASGHGNTYEDMCGSVACSFKSADRKKPQTPSHLRLFKTVFG